MVVEINENDCSVIRWSPDGKTDWKSANIDDLIHAYEQKHGLWIEDIEQSAKHIEKIYFCSNCGDFEAWGETELYNYCPNCGAKMKRE